MADNYGISFAPTQENAQQGPINAQIDGLPAAIKILALRLPKVLGAQAVAPSSLLNGQGARGLDPIAGAVMATMARALGTHAMGLPGGAPNPWSNVVSNTPLGGLPAPDQGAVSWDPRISTQNPPPARVPFAAPPNPMAGRGRQGY